MKSLFKQVALYFGVFSAGLQAVFIFDNQSATIRLNGANAQISLQANLPNIDGTIEVTNKSATSFIQAAAETVSFNNGIYSSASSNKSVLTGTINPATTDTIILNAGQTMETESGTIAEAVEIQGAGNQIKGQPQFSSAIVLQNASAELQIGIQNKLNQNITMNDGTVTLIDDLSLANGVTFDGDGVVDVNNKTLTLPFYGSAITGTLDFENANDIQLSGYTTFSGTANFTGTGTTVLNGNGNVLDISGGGVLNLAAGHTLYLTDIHVKGLGASGGDFALTATSEIIMSNCTLELAGNFAHDAGKITVQGDNCKVIVEDTEKFNITGGTTTLDVDGVTLLYDPLGTAPITPNPFVTASGGTINLLNNGIIRTNFEVGTGGGAFTNDQYTLASETMPDTKFLSANGTITFMNATPLVPKTIAFDGQGQCIFFNGDLGQYFIVEENVTLTLTDITLKGFDPALIDFQGAGATEAEIVFGDGVVLELNKDFTVGTKALVFDGDATVAGDGHAITLTAADMMTIDNANTLTLDDVTIKTENATGLHALDDAATILMRNSNLIMNAAGLTFDTGDLEVEGNVCFQGLDPTAVGTIPTFSFTTSGTAVVQANSTLKIAAFTEFSYDPDISGDGAVVAVEKGHVSLLNPSSSIIMDNATWKTGTMGFALNHGSVYIDGKTIFDIDTTAGAEFEIGSALQVNIAPAAVLDIDGAIIYKTTSFP